MLNLDPHQLVKLIARQNELMNLADLSYQTYYKKQTLHEFWQEHLWDYLGIKAELVENGLEDPVA